MTNWSARYKKVPLFADSITLRVNRVEEGLGVLPIVRYGGPQCTIRRNFSISFALKI